jgi:hypothetical protein
MIAGQQDGCNNDLHPSVAAPSGAVPCLPRGILRRFILFCSCFFWAVNVLGNDDLRPSVVAPSGAVPRYPGAFYGAPSFILLRFFCGGGCICHEDLIQ